MRFLSVNSADSDDLIIRIIEQKNNSITKEPLMMGNFVSASVGNFACVTDKSALRVSLYRDNEEKSPELVSFLAKE